MVRPPIHGAPTDEVEAPQNVFPEPERSFLVFGRVAADDEAALFRVVRFVGADVEEAR